MKKISKLMLMLIVCLNLTACGPNNKVVDDKTNNDNQETKQNETGKKITPADSYSAYLELKSKTIGDLTDNIPEENYSLPLELLGFTMVDLTMIPITFCGLDESERVGLSLLYDKFTYEYKGNKCIFSFEDEDGKSRYETIFDSKRDAMQTKMFVNDKLTFINEYIKCKNGYAAQYYVASEENNTTYRTIFRSSYIMTGIFNDVTKEPESIYNSSCNFGDDWLTAGNTWSKYDNGVFSSNK